MHYEKVGDEGPICVEEELPFELPEGWCWSRLGCIGHWQSGATPKRSNPAYFKAGGVNWLLTGDLNDGFVYRPSGRITQLAVEETSVKLNPAGSVLLAMYGATIGKTGILGVESTTNQACCACLPLCTIPPMFVQSFLKVNKPVFLKQGIGGAQPNISKEIIVNTLIPLPPLAEQQRIVEALGHYLALVDDIEHNQTELDELLTKTRSKVLDLAIRGKLVAQDPTDEPASVLLERIHQEKLQMVADGKLKKKDVAGDSIIYRGEDNSYYERRDDGSASCIDDELSFELPSGWCWSRFCSPYINRDGERRPVKAADRAQTKKTYDYYGASGAIDKVDSFLFEGRLLLIGEDGANLLSRSVPLAYFADGKYWVNNHAHVIDAANSLLLSWACAYINAVDLAEIITGTAQPKLTQKNLNNLLIPIPPLNEQQRIVERINACNDIKPLDQ